LYICFSVSGDQLICTVYAVVALIIHMTRHAELGVCIFCLTKELSVCKIPRGGSRRVSV